MIEQVLGEGDMPRGCAAILGQFFRATIFCVGFFNSPMPFLGRFYQYLLFLAGYYVYSQTVFWAQNFLDVQLIPNSLKYPA